MAGNERSAPVGLPARRAAGALLASCAVLLPFAFASDAAAAAPIDLGAASESPRVVVDAAGTGYLTWADGSQAVHYCRLPQGGSACGTSRLFTYGPGLGLDQGSFPVLADTRVLIANDRFGSATSPANGATGLYESTDGGLTFDPPTQPGTTVGTDSDGIEGTVIFAPEDSLGAGAPEALLTIGGATKSGGPTFQATPTSGTPTSASFSMSAGAATNSSSLAMEGTTLVAAYTNLDSPNAAFSRQYLGGPPNQAIHWGAAEFITDVGSSTTQVVAGPGGIYFAYTTEADAVAIRKYNAGTWGAPLDVTPALTSSSSRFAAVEDPDGIVHVAYVDNDGNLAYRYARNAANDDFTNPQILVPSGPDVFDDLRMAVDAAGNGYVSWYDGVATARAVPFAPGEGPAGEYKGPTKKVKTPLDKDTDIVMKVPKDCVAAGASFEVSVKLKEKKKGGSKGKKKTKRKITRVDFSVGKTLVLKDKKKPFKTTISTIGATGSVKVTAKVTVKVTKPGKKAKKKKKKVKQTVAIC